MSWLEFIVPVLICIAIIYIPGFLLLSAIRFPRSWCIAGAPVFSLLLYIVLGLSFTASGCPTSAPALACLALGLSAFAWAASAVLHKKLAREGRHLSKKLTHIDGNGVGSPSELASLLVYLTAGAVIGGAVFVAAVGRPDAYIQSYDNVTHLAMMKYFADSNVFNPIGASNYASMAPEIAPFFTGSGFYPSMWHVVGAMIMDLSGASVAVATNAEAFVTDCIVYPLCLAAFMMYIFQGNRKAILLGALASVSFTAFPWSMLIRGPLYPNMLAFATVPFIVLLLLGFISDRTPRRQRISCLAAFLLGMVVLVFVQTNAVFTVGVFAASFLIWKASSLSSQIPILRKWGVAGKIALGLIAIALILGIWCIAYNLPFLQNVVQYEWPSWLSKRQALVNVLTLSLWKNSAAQLFMAFLVLVGLVCALLKREYRPLVAVYAVVCAMYFFSSSSNGFLDSFLTGFWYSDQCRVAAMVAMAAVPLASLGASAVFEGVAAFLRFAASGASMKSVTACSVAVILGVWAFVFYPSCQIDGFTKVNTAFGSFLSRSKALYGTSDSQRHLSEREAAFIQKASEVVDDGLVLNDPFDGSVYAFMVDDLPVYYRTLRAFDTDAESEDSAVVREGIQNVATDAEVRDALRDTGIRYVLLLDQNGGEEDNPGPHPGYRERHWEALDSLNDKTPGLNVILSDGDMRLYEIDPALLEQEQ